MNIDKRKRPVIGKIGDTPIYLIRHRKKQDSTKKPLFNEKSIALILRKSDVVHEDCNNCNRYMDDCDGKSKDGDWIAPNKQVRYQRILS